MNKCEGILGKILGHRFIKYDFTLEKLPSNFYKKCGEWDMSILKKLFHKGKKIIKICPRCGQHKEEK